MRTDTPVRLWVKVCGRNRLLDRPGRQAGYRYVYFGLFKVRRQGSTAHCSAVQLACHARDLLGKVQPVPRSCAPPAHWFPSFLS
jgi:hypothetical protein